MKVNDVAEENDKKFRAKPWIDPISATVVALALYGAGVVLDRCFGPSMSWYLNWVAIWFLLRESMAMGTTKLWRGMGVHRDDGETLEG